MQPHAAVQAVRNVSGKFTKLAKLLRKPSLLVETIRKFEFPPFRNGLRFREIRIEDRKEMRRLVEIYNSAWFDRDRIARKFSKSEVGSAEALCIREEELRAQSTAFSEGQFVGIVTVKDKDGISTEVPVCMLNTLVLPVETIMDIPGGYGAVTRDRTFKDHVHPKKLSQQQGVLLCVSIAVAPEFQGKDYAQETLKAALRFAKKHTLLVVPYSAPRGFGEYLKKHPGTTIEDYLYLTNPIEEENKIRAYKTYVGKIAEFNKRDTIRAYRQKLKPLPYHEFVRYGYDLERITAYESFKEVKGNWFVNTYGRDMTIVDYIRLTGRTHIDPVMNMHIQLGADFIYHRNGEIACVFENSRTEDIRAAGYNILLTYSHAPDVFTDRQRSAA